MSDFGKYEHAIRILAELHVKALKERAEEMNKDHHLELPESTENPWTAELLAETLEEQLHDGGILEDIQKEVRKLLRTKVQLTFTVLEENVQKLLDTLAVVQKDAQKAGDEEFAVSIGEIWDAVRGAEQKSV